ncbi:MAG: hypothetical protein HOK21_21145 [Rhodospirillaceae bacterium]|jgi:hypothetical protein|nr:hypothetical protein [Rhodospirillaceae bacterium]MBT4046341.1 hypothetical protein [Rhodospirillaceae bacterium]MBT4690791.1 hypothetical protein [Rhodospirillaceae bacterium]MBT5080531.1 hypothetical protein [Rhodospirillaceae bacterium]MBT5526600.1 hypothetical protein [Rhodospirillaceae bacterium]
MVRVLLCFAGLALLAGCLQQQPNWYEDRCLRLGFKKGSPGFADCIQRDKKWIDDNKDRARTNGAGP